MGISSIYIDSMIKDAIDEIIEKIGSESILKMKQTHNGLYQVDLDPTIITIACNSDDFRIVRFDLDGIRHAKIDSSDFGRVVII